MLLYMPVSEYSWDKPIVIIIRSVLNQPLTRTEPLRACLQYQGKGQCNPEKFPREVGVRPVTKIARYGWCDYIG